jgi:hypothetical protein
LRTNYVRAKSYVNLQLCEFPTPSGFFSDSHKLLLFDRLRKEYGLMFGEFLKCFDRIDRTSEGGSGRGRMIKACEYIFMLFAPAAFLRVWSELRGKTKSQRKELIKSEIHHLFRLPNEHTFLKIFTLK